MNDEQGPSLAWTVGVLKGLLTGEDADSRNRDYGRALTDAIERLSGNTRDQNECNLTWTINSLRERIESMGAQTGIMRACLETQKLEQLESRMDEIADRVAHERTGAARERTSTHEAQRPSH
jgi:hypothetical protein